jgi:ribosomal protein S18 acetylase RimI-like enzyme
LIQFRCYKNGDSPGLATLWNRGLPDRAVVRPLTAHEFDALVIGKLHFDRHGLIVAHDGGRLIGYVHAGFGPKEPNGPSHQLDRTLGTIAMLAIDPDSRSGELAAGLLNAAEHYLASKGAQVVYAGGHFPLNPFYWGIYGGSEFAGILHDHTDFHAAAKQAGYQVSAQTQLFEADLARDEPRDPKTPLLRRTLRTEVEEDSLSPGWWSSIALGLFRPSTYHLIEKNTNRIVASARSWDYAGSAGVNDGRSRICMIETEVDATCRRRGFGRFLVLELLRHAREQGADVVCAQTASTNDAAISLYQSAGFEPVDVATLYRKPAP